MSADTKSTTRHAICPVRYYDPAAWQGWTIAKTERVQPPAGKLAHVPNQGVKNRLFPSHEASTGEGWDVHHLVKRGVR